MMAEITEAIKPATLAAIVTVPHSTRGGESMRLREEYEWIARKSFLKKLNHQW